MVDRKLNTTSPAKVNVGDLMAFVYFAKVTEKKAWGKETEVTVEPLDNNQGKFNVRGDDLITNALSADQYSEEVKCTKTELAEILLNSINQPFTVCFNKQDGKERTLRGRLLSAEPLLGRSYVEDFDIKSKKPTDRMRQVDHRTLKFVITGGTKYITK